MGVQFMQAEGLYSQLLQVGNLAHIGQHEACYNWKHAAAAGEGGNAGYFKTLLEAEEASICSDDHYNTHILQAEDTKPLIMSSLEINGHAHNKLPVQKSILPINSTNTSSSAKLAATYLAASTPKAAKCVKSDSKPSASSIISPLKRAREAASHKEGAAVIKKEKKATVEGNIIKEKGKKEQLSETAGATPAAAPSSTSPAPILSGRKASSVKTKAPKPAAAPPVQEPPRTDYVHVRARRGQATDSHSLAERVRREKISERMRFLQDLVPGCSKITGKALILDEIINYVQSLQNQVEFLAMRLAATNPNIDHASLRGEEIASPFVDEVRDCTTAMLPKAITALMPNLDLHFDSLPAFYSGFFDDSNFNSSIVSDLSTSTCNDSHLTSMDFSHLG